MLSITPARADLPESSRPWSVAWPTYSPVDITPPELQADALATSHDAWIVDHTADPTSIDYAERQAVALVSYEVVDGRPRNPFGRTGRVGRDLGKWAENAAADPIVVADTSDGRFVLLIERDDCHQWAIPGGMVDPGETAPAALVRELREETGVDLADVEPVVLARTYVDDPRNTDNAWVCSTVALYRTSARLEALAGDDAAAARWLPFGDLAELCGAVHRAGGELYSAHFPLLMSAAAAIAAD
ncbi:NUDIX domain-containing protein [Cryptosporangium aurantiacum]|uniref:ADP-ribose pyrophosphatase YjhB, NUDIX family n=1 Tax=Cryptosporangium aurantiacum TaxID=134849 RepID=A0A1M7RPP3_9ACTN|nr:NUDIX domain-containing protein [Cryptosporangium aurantiacum]SHN48199.1 ADP-ribose pyrophosphatase YjhB, NUDIX family [Cryptosporangium aurantiacum]